MALRVTGLQRVFKGWVTVPSTTRPLGLNWDTDRVHQRSRRGGRRYHSDGKHTSRVGRG